eukprot:m.226496 g.226496  ORF g.226496 m.226496 type:complete len:495 (-) comp25932_c0_seq1:700-2184(-)
MAGTGVTFTALHPAIGCRADISPRDVAASSGDAEIFRELANAIATHSVVLLRPDRGNVDEPVDSLTPQEISEVYTKVHHAMGWNCWPPHKLPSQPQPQPQAQSCDAPHAGCGAPNVTPTPVCFDVPPTPERNPPPLVSPTPMDGCNSNSDSTVHDAGLSTDVDVNLRGACFPGFPETNVLGCISGLQDWHGLTGFLTPTAWWEMHSCQFHQDGGFSGESPPPPALVAMYCEETPTEGAATLQWPTEESLPYAPGATLFFSTRTALELADPMVVERARNMTCVYRAGFGRVVDEEYPIMSPSGIVSESPAPIPAAFTGVQRPVAPPPHRSSSQSDEMVPPAAVHAFKSLENFAFDGAAPAIAGAAAMLYQVSDDGHPEFAHSLVQEDEAGRPFILCHGLCLDHLEENGVVLAWRESAAFVDALLGPTAKPPYLLALEWAPGDLAIWDNRTTQHSVTPSHGCGDTTGYAVLGGRRLMTRTAMQPDWTPTLVTPRQR